MNAETPIRKPRGAFFGRRKGHPLRAGQANLIDALLPGLALDLGQPAPRKPNHLFGANVDGAANCASPPTGPARTSGRSCGSRARHFFNGPRSGPTTGVNHGPNIRARDMRKRPEKRAGAPVT